MDLVVLPHQLEFSDTPHQILREAERILMPEGKLVITGFNPVSLWGLYRKFSSKKDREETFPWNGEFISLSRLKDWLSLLSLEITGGSFGYYRPPNLSVPASKRLAFLEKAGNRWWPTAGGVYLICATKKVYGMTILPSFQTARQSKTHAETATVLPSQPKGYHDSSF